MGNRRIALTVATAVAAFAVVPVASAYVIPGPPGTPGGPPTTATNGTGTSKGATNKVAKDAAGFTAGELAGKGSLDVKVHFPKAGKMTCGISAGSTKLGSGSTKASKAESKHLNVNFSSSGDGFLNAHNGDAVKLTVSCKFKPNSGTSSRSTATVVTDP